MFGDRTSGQLSSFEVLSSDRETESLNPSLHDCLLYRLSLQYDPSTGHYQLVEQQTSWSSNQQSFLFDVVFLYPLASADVHLLGDGNLPDENYRHHLSILQGKETACPYLYPCDVPVSLHMERN